MEVHIELIGCKRSGLLPLYKAQVEGFKSKLYVNKDAFLGGLA